ncbi:substrate-binding periplasmic protein [Desulfovibrio gilichinskyi]|uniref:Amino acid ABC transporter substrate-binding protein, PAAT family n=1 Tax=Desulfovibrio gilichinskyi TaxID=1519643 RepID=A0A1X7ELR4_9BACT|nr:transporter substrate-binding domain-containing protein [Desulfovibrio gilichinskyi]SMF35704.1 amino acid ABC transporter substrate-binding protein, PAAT family [Desulfovibrio gilichinskyi]
MSLHNVMKRFALSLIILFLFCFNAFPSPAIRISSVVYPPITSEKVLTGLGYGMCIDIVTEAFKAVSVGVDYDLLPMSRNVWSIIRLNDDACLGTMGWFRKAEAEKLVDYVDVVNLNFMGFYRKSSFPGGVSFNYLDELKDYRFGSVRGSGSQKTLEAAKLKVDFAHDIRLVFLKLNARRTDFAVAFRVTGNYLIKKLFPNNVADYAYMEKPLLKAPISLIFLKDKVKLKKRFLDGLKIIAKNGTYHNILVRYYGDAGIPDGTIPDFILENMGAGKE